MAVTLFCATKICFLVFCRISCFLVSILLGTLAVVLDKAKPFDQANVFLSDIFLFLVYIAKFI